MRKPEYCKHGTSIAFFCEVCANDEITKLREENQRLRALLRRAVDDLEQCAKHTNYQSTIIYAIRKQLEGE